MQLRVDRVGRYLKNNPRLVWKFQYQQQPKSVDVFVDADFAARESNAEIYVWSCGVLRESADRVCIHTEHRSSGVLRNHEVLSAQLAQAGPLERIRGDGGSSCLVGRECWHRDRIAPRLRTTEAS